MNGKVTDADQLLERAYLAGMDKEFRDDLRSTLDALTFRQPTKPEAVRLRDELRERAAFENWAENQFVLTRKDAGYLSTLTTYSWEAWQAALASVQPSPAGQGDALQPCPFCGEQLTINGAGDGVHPRDSVCILAQHVVVVDHAPHAAAWNRRALAVRQPVGDSQ